MPPSFRTVGDNKARAEQHDPELQPEFVGGDARLEDLRNRQRVRDYEADQNRPENVFDVGEYPVVGLGVGVDRALKNFRGIADAGEQKNAGHDAQRAQPAIIGFHVRQRG